MHIRRVIAKGFKTYRDSITVGEFDPKLNCIVGFNGSGKSSLFQAIIFVLCPHMNGQFLHEGSLGKSLSGFVEIELDNADRHFPVDSDVVSIRRTIVGINRGDELLLNGKQVSKTDLIALFQTTGLLGSTSAKKKRRGGASSSLPYYIVEQGRVATVATISDGERFDLLKESAGVEVFAEKKMESIEILQDTKCKRDRINELIADIECKCRDLEKESEEMQEYSSLKREKEMTEYKLSQLELDQLTALKESLSSELVGVNSKINSNLSAIDDLREREVVVEAEIERAAQAPEKSASTATLEKTLEELRRYIAQKQDLVDQNEAQVSKLISQLSEITGLTADLNLKKEKVESDIESDRARISELRMQAGDLAAKRKTLESELSAISAVATSDGFQERISEISLLLQSLTRRKTFIEKDLESREHELSNLTSISIPESAGEVSRISSELDSLTAAESLSQSTRSGITRRLGEMNRESFQGKQKIYELEREKDKLDREFNELMNGSVLRSSNVNTREILARSDISGLKGLFGDFLRIPAVYRTAVESACRSALFNIVITTDDVADTVAAKLAVTGNRGRVTLTPINRVTDESAAANELASALQHGKFSAQLLSSVIQVSNNVSGDDTEWVKRFIVKNFARTVICDSLDTCVQVAKKFRVDTVTVDGDMVSKDLVVRGGGSGGNSLAAKRKLGVVKNWQQALEIKQRISDLNAKIKDVKDASKKMENEIRDLEADIAEMGQNDNTSTKVNIQTTREALAAAKRKTAALMDRAKELEMYEIVNLRDVDLRAVVDEIHRLTVESVKIKSILDSGEMDRSQMSQSEKAAKLESARDSLAAVQREIDGVETSIAAASKQLAMNRSELVHFVEHRLSHLRDVAEEKQREKTHLMEYIEKSKLEITRIQMTDLVRAEADIEELRRRVAIETEQRAEFQNELASIANSIGELELGIAELRSQTSGIELRIGSVENEIKNVTANLRNVSALSGDITMWPQDVPVRLLRSRIVELNAAMTNEKFAYINRKAVEQFERIRSERDTLLSKKSEIEASHAAIEKLLDSLNEKENEIIRSSFEKVKKQFTKLFDRITDGDGQSSMSLTLSEGSAESWLSIEVSFPITEEGEKKPLKPKKLHELSGGQRTVVALCFLMALQRAAPGSSSFFILDEVDAALDSNYRSAIAEALFEESARGVQFLFTSFRPEFCSVGNKHWLVSMVNGTSQVRLVDVASAMMLVNGQDENEAPQHLNIPSQQEVSLRE